jgi:hypothetical protein
MRVPGERNLLGRSRRRKCKYAGEEGTGGDQREAFDHGEGSSLPSLSQVSDQGTREASRGAKPPLRWDLPNAGGVPEQRAEPGALSDLQSTDQIRKRLGWGFVCYVTLCC